MNLPSLRRRLTLLGLVLLAASIVAPLGVASDVPVTSEGKLNPAGGTQGDYFGSLVALSGETALIGAYARGSNTGAAYVFIRNGASWSQQARLSASDAAVGDYFGYALALDGDTALVGAYGKKEFAGAVYVFTRSGSAWSQQAKLTPSDPAANDGFGVAVALDGDTALVGAFGKNSNTGAAYVFTRKGTAWSQQAKLTASDSAAADSFGLSVSLSGETALVGAWAKSSFTGAAYVFVRNGTSWSQQAKLAAADKAAGDDFGAAVEIRGETAVVGAASKDAGKGAAYVFVRSGTSWSQQARVSGAGGAASDFFGASIEVRDDILAVGATGRNAFTGAVYLFRRTGTGWNQQAYFSASDGMSGDYFGVGTALGADTILVGAMGTVSNACSAYVYRYSAPPSLGPASSSAVSSASATLSASLASLGTAREVSVSFEYGPTTTYGNATPPQTLSASGSFSTTLSGLTPGQAYHFRAKADGGAAGISYSPDAIFTTPALPVATTTQPVTTTSTPPATTPVTSAPPTNQPTTTPPPTTTQPTTVPTTAAPVTTTVVPPPTTTFLPPTKPGIPPPPSGMNPGDRVALVVAVLVTLACGAVLWNIFKLVSPAEGAPPKQKEERPKKEERPLVEEGTASWPKPEPEAEVRVVSMDPRTRLAKWVREFRLRRRWAESRKNDKNQ